MSNKHHNNYGNHYRNNNQSKPETENITETAQVVTDETETTNVPDNTVTIPEDQTTPVQPDAVDQTADDTQSEPEAQDEPVIGVVCNCAKLNIRVAPNKDADIAIVINKDTKVIINETNSTDDFYAVEGVPVEMPDGRFTVENGYCMKKYIKVN